ncbi:penicillin-binding protein 2, partial [Microcoleus sp. LEGE 07076]|nr:penicillin-binding protein 2 [Microcoleus sp. LEGE 07076]
MSYDPRFDRYRSPNFKRPKPSGDRGMDSDAARTLWEKKSKPRVSGTNGPQAQQTVPPWPRWSQERLKRNKFRLWAVWAVV